MSSPPEIEIKSPRTRQRLVVAAVGLMLGLHAVLAVHAGWRLSVTHDEYWHLPVGLLSWKTGRFDFDAINPPLTRFWSAAPLLATAATTGPADPALGPGGHGDAFLRANGERYRMLYALGRGMTVVFSLMTAVVLAVWAKELFGWGACCLTVLLWTTCPTILANTSLVTPDMGVTFFYVAAFYAMWKHARQPTGRGAAIVGLLVGLAQAAKFTALLLYPLCVIVWCLVRWGQKPGFFEKPGFFTRQCLAALAVSVVVLNAVYLFRGSFSPIASFDFRCRALSRLNDAPRWVRALPVPLPRDYLEGLDRQRQIMEGAHPVYLDKEWSTEGFPRYYLMALLYKLPHALQALVLLAALSRVIPASLVGRFFKPSAPAVGRISNPSENTDELKIRPTEPTSTARTQLVLLLPAITLLGVASTSGMQLGVRYVLPILPFLMLFAGQAANCITSKEPGHSGPVARLMKVLVTVAIAAMPWSLRYHPHHLAYFNELSGGPVAGRLHLVDSNLDWGQALYDLREELKHRGIDDVGLAYFGTFPPESLGIKYHLPPSWAPRPGWYAISANFVQGRPHVIRDPQGPPHGLNLGEYAYFRFFEPVAHVGYAIELYRLTEVDVLRWNAVRQRP